MSIECPIVTYDLDDIEFIRWLSRAGLAHLTGYGQILLCKAKKTVDFEDFRVEFGEAEAGFYNYPPDELEIQWKIFCASRATLQEQWGEYALHRVLNG